LNNGLKPGSIGTVAQPLALNEENQSLRSIYSTAYQLTFTEAKFKRC